MPARFTNKERETIYGFLIEKAGGERCARCGAKPELGRKLAIDHKDDNKDNNLPQNFQLLCKSCNTAKENTRRAAAARAFAAVGAVDSRRPNIAENSGTKHEYSPPPNVPTDLRERERVLNEGQSLAFLHTSKVTKNYLGYEDGSPELRANNYFEDAWESFILGKLGHDGYISKEDAIYAASYHIGCNPLTAQRYFNKWTSSAGPLVRNSLRFQVPVWELKAKAVESAHSEAAKQEEEAIQKVRPIRR